MIKKINQLYRSYPKNIWGITALLILFILRKTLFNVARGETNLEISIDSNSSLGLLAIGLSIAYILNHQRLFDRSFKLCVPIVLYYLFAIISVLWAESLGGPLFKGTEMLVCCSLIGMIMILINNVKRSMFYVVIITTITTGIDYWYHFVNFQTLIMHTNTFTITAAVGLMLSIELIKQKYATWRELGWLVAVNLFWLVVGTSSASYISAIIGLLFVFAQTRQKMRYYRIILISGMVYTVYDFLEPYLLEYVFYGHAQEDIESGTGRDIIWGACINSWKSSPILGHGFVAGEKSLANFGALGYRSAHNAILSVMVNTGVVGLLLFLVALYKWILWTIRATKVSRSAKVLLPAIVTFMVNILSCPIVGSDFYPESIPAFALMCIVYIYMRPNRIFQENR